MELNGLLSFLHSHIKKRLERYEFQYGYSLFGKHGSTIKPS